MIIRFQLLAALPCDPLPVALLSYKHTAHTDPSIPLPKLPILVLLRHLSTYCRPAPGRGQCSFANSRAPLERPCSITVRAKPVAFGRNTDEGEKKRQREGWGSYTDTYTRWFHYIIYHHPHPVAHGTGTSCWSCRWRSGLYAAAYLSQHDPKTRGPFSTGERHTAGGYNGVHPGTGRWRPRPSWPNKWGKFHPNKGKLAGQV